MIPSCRKLTVCGDKGCGKTSLLYLLERGELPEHIGVPGPVGEVSLDGNIIVFGFWETTTDEYERLNPLAYLGACVVLLVFAVNDLFSLENVVKKWNAEVVTYCPYAPKLLIGTKTDLCSENVLSTSMERGSNLARKLGAHQYLQCSAFTKEGVNDVFEMAARISLHQDHMAKRRNRCMLL